MVRGALLLLLLLGSCKPAPPPPAAVSAPVQQLDWASAEWRGLPPCPLAARDSAQAIWTGDRLIVWGGWARTGGFFITQSFHKDGAIYDPATEQWRKTGSAPLEGRTAFVAAWTGERMLVWGGYRSAGTDNWGFEDGAAYDPGRSTWVKLPSAPLEPRAFHSLTFTGTSIIVWGGSHGDHVRWDGAELIARPK